jgi:hypothetical protein
MINPETETLATPGNVADPQHIFVTKAEMQTAINEILLDVAASIEFDTLWPDQNMHKTDALLAVVIALREAVQ